MKSDEANTRLMRFDEANTRFMRFDEKRICPTALLSQDCEVRSSHEMQ